MNESNVQEVASSLANLTSDPGILTPVDLVHTSTVLEEITSVPNLDEEVGTEAVLHYLYVKPLIHMEALKGQIE